MPFHQGSLLFFLHPIPSAPYSICVLSYMCLFFIHPFFIAHLRWSMILTQLTVQLHCCVYTCLQGYRGKHFRQIRGKYIPSTATATAWSCSIISCSWLGNPGMALCSNHACTIFPTANIVGRHICLYLGLSDTFGILSGGNI